MTTQLNDVWWGKYFRRRGSIEQLLSLVWSTDHQQTNVFVLKKLPMLKTFFLKIYVYLEGNSSPDTKRCSVDFRDKPPAAYSHGAVHLLQPSQLERLCRVKVKAATLCKSTSSHDGHLLPFCTFTSQTDR